MQRANDITIAAYKAALATCTRAWTSASWAPTSRPPTGARREGFAMVSFGKYTAFPHGSITPQKLQRRRHGPDRRRLHGGGLPVRHHADHRLRQAHGAPARGLGSRAQGAGRRTGRRQAGRDLRIGGCGGAQSDHGCRIRSRLQGSGTAAPHRPRHRARRPRMDEPGEGQQDEDRAGHVFQQRADHRDLRRVRRPPGGLHVHDAEEGARMFTRQSPAIDQPFG